MSASVFSGLSTSISNLFSAESGVKTKTILATIGTGLILYKAFSFAQILMANRAQAQASMSTDLASRHGKNTWALVTNTSDKIGKMFASELASKGFNIILIGANSQQLKVVEKELRINYPTIQTKVIEFDFVNGYTKGFAKLIYKQLQEYDVSILVNNVGLEQLSLETNSSVTASSNERKNKVVISSLAHTLLTKAFMPKLAARSYKSCVINVASFVSSCPKAPLQPSGSKLFEEYLANTSIEEHPNVDVLSLKPAKVSEEMIDSKQVDTTWCSSPDHCVLPTRRSSGNIRKASEDKKEEEELISSIPAFLNKNL